MNDESRGTCHCAERTGDLVVFTCPVCCDKALAALRVLTNRAVVVKLDKEGSVSGLELELEPLWLETE